MLYLKGMDEFKGPIIFFDGVCGLCNTFVDFVMPRDSKRIFRFATLQGETAKKLLAPQDYKNLDSVVLYDQGKVFKRSQAVLEIFQRLGAPWSVLSIFKVIPSFLRNPVYDLVAKTRYQLFGQKESCRLPTPEERAQFLD